MSQFFISSFFEPRHNKCRKIIEELEKLTKNITSQRILEISNNVRIKTISPHFIKQLRSAAFPLNNLSQSLDEIIPNYFKESEKFIENNQEFPKVRKGRNTIELRCFEKLKYILAEVAHIIHYNSIAFELGHFLNPEKENAYFSLLKPKEKIGKIIFEKMKPSIEFDRNNGSLESKNIIFFSFFVHFFFYFLFVFLFHFLGIFCSFLFIFVFFLFIFFFIFCLYFCSLFCSFFSSFLGQFLVFFFKQIDFSR